MNDAGKLDDDATQGAMPPWPYGTAPEQIPAESTAAPEPNPHQSAPRYDQQQSGVARYDAQPSTAAQPPAAETKRTGLLAGLIGGGALLLVLLVAGGIWFAIETGAHTPQAAVQPFMTALVKGDVAAIVKAGNIDTRSPLITQSVYAATTDRITGYSIKPASTGGGTATVSVSYKQGANRHTETLQLKKSGTDMLFFTKWTLEPVPLPTVKIAVDGPSSDGVQVNGADVTVDENGTTVLDALPGRYTATMASNPAYSAADASATVTAISSTTTASVDSMKLAISFTDAGQKAANDAVNAWVAACVAQRTIRPSGCSFGLTNDFPDFHLSNQKWTLRSAPKFEIGPWDGAGWTVLTTENGAATFLADFSADDGSTGTVFSEEPVPVEVAGEITGFDSSGKARFRSIDWSGKASLPTA